jgi:formylglycine-generating enzyme required for sulfatase activity
LAFSARLAIHFYHKLQAGGELILEKEEAIQLAKDNNIELKPDEITGKSLLTCDANSNWKFAHKSILEFFIAKEAIQNFKFGLTINLAGLDMVKTFLEVPDFLTGLNGPSFVFVKGGTFSMGDEKGDLGSDSRDVHKVTLSDFYIQKVPVTQKQWRNVMGDNPSHFKGCDDCPVEWVSWNDVQGFIGKLNDMNAGLRYASSEDAMVRQAHHDAQPSANLLFRLPTEAEWEYAARGGIESKGYLYSGSNDPDEVGWYDKNSGKNSLCDYYDLYDSL